MADYAGFILLGMLAVVLAIYASSRRNRTVPSMEERMDQLYQDARGGRITGGRFVSEINAMVDGFESEAGGRREAAASVRGKIRDIVKECGGADRMTARDHDRIRRALSGLRV